jgi:hypothetical protein
VIDAHNAAKAAVRANQRDTFMRQRDEAEFRSHE